MAIPLHNKEIIRAVEEISSTYSPLTPQCQTEFAKVSKIISVKKSAILVKEGQHADKLYYVLNGCLRVFYLKDGNEISDWFAFESDFVSSINSFFLEIPSPHYVQAMEDTTYLEISRQNVFSLTVKHHCIETLARKAITQIMLQLQHRIVAIQFENAQQRYDNLIKIRPDILQRVPLMHIASYLGITLETLSRVRNPKNRI